MHFTLEELGLVDAPPEQEFDNLTKLAAELLSVPVAHVSIADQKNGRIFYKSQHGHPEGLAKERELPMELTYCQHVALTSAPVIVSDARIHPLLAGTPALSEGQPNAYLGIPIKAPGGKVIGGLCMMQEETRRWAGAEIATAQMIASCVSDLIRLKTAMLSSERLRREQREFTYAISHDLQSPTNTLKMIFNELSLESEGMSRDARMFIDNGLATIQRMGIQVEDVLTYSRTVDSDTKVEPVDLQVLMQGILADLSSDIQVAKTRIDCGDLPVVYGDPMQLRMFFQNLVANALKFRSSDREHVVSINAVNDNKVRRICVKDNGIGISPENQEKVFGLFNRLNLRDQYPGTGIGLSLCQRVAENHHVAIEIASDGSNGCEFSVEFPGRAA